MDPSRYQVVGAVELNLTVALVDCMLNVPHNDISFFSRYMCKAWSNTSGSSHMECTVEGEAGEITLQLNCESNKSVL